MRLLMQNKIQSPPPPPILNILHHIRLEKSIFILVCDCRILDPAYKFNCKAYVIITYL